MAGNFMNFELGAMNVLTAPVDPAIAARFQPLASASPPPDDYAVIRPKWNSDIQWVSPNTEATFALFQAAFDEMGVAAMVAGRIAVDRAPRMYAGFIVLRTRCSAPNFHVDWTSTGTQAFTLITPISRNTKGFGLLYEKVTGSIGEYDYSPDEAILFSDDFSHSTKAGRSTEPVALLSFTFGTDRMEEWDRIVDTTGYQCLLIRQPDGQFAVTSPGLKTPQWRTISPPAP
jgi:hypothetical protein